MSLVSPKSSFVVMAAVATGRSHVSLAQRPSLALARGEGLAYYSA